VNKKSILLGLVCLTFIAAAIPTLVMAEDDEHEGGGFFSSMTSHRTDFAPVTDPAYKKECGSCHMAYPPGLLPARSWQKIVANLADHFGDNAELPKEDANKILAYLNANAADKSEGKRSRQIMSSIGNSTPLRISEMSYIKRRHHELSRRHIQDNPKVKYLGNCGACHPNGEKGSFREGEVRIPGFGRWD